MTNENKPELPSAEAIDPEQSEPTTKSSAPKALALLAKMENSPRMKAMQQTPEFKAKVLKAMAKAEQRRKENPSPQKQLDELLNDPNFSENDLKQACGLMRQAAQEMLSQNEPSNVSEPMKRALAKISRRLNQDK